MSSSYYGKAPLHWGCSAILAALLLLAFLLLCGLPVILNFVLDGVTTW
jgi:hypothetical protein